MGVRLSTALARFQGRAGQVFAFVPKGEGMMLVSVPALNELAGLARGAKPEDYRDRTDRV